MTLPLRFDSFFMAGFECSSHRRRDGTRLDLLCATQHDALVGQDYRACRALGINTARDGLRWHLIETSPGVYDWSSWVPMLEAGAETGMQVLWDTLHYGSPDWLDQGSPAFIDAYARFASEAVRVHRSVTGTAPVICPINEISYFTWAAKNGSFQTSAHPGPGEFKRHLVRAAISGVEAMRAEEPGCRFISAEPLIHVAAPSDELRGRAEGAHASQYEAIDLLLGLREPELGGRPDLLDAVGLNFYPDNQWYLEGSTIPLGHHDYRPLSSMLAEASARYAKPVFIAETMAEGSARPAWLHYVCQEVREAMRQGVRIEGVCLYPVAAYPGWDDYRLADVGLFSGISDGGGRTVYAALADELLRQQGLFEAA